MRQHCLFLFLLLVGGCHGDDGFEDRPYDGWYNNLDHPEWGAAETPMLRQSPTAYSDGVYGPSGAGRPNPLDISKAAHQGRTGLPSFVGRTAMLVFFGQQLVEEIVDSQRPGCPVEYFNIPVPTGHPQFDPRANGDIEMTFKRSRYDFTTGYSPNNPRKQLNEITPFLDGQVIYGPNKAWTDAIRELKGGRLAASSPDNIMMSFPPNNTARLPYSNPPVAREHKLKPVSRFHALGNPRGNENPFLLAFGILWHRWHNFQAGQIALKHPEYTDEQIFNIARKRVTAQYQKIVFYDWLPVWLNTSVSPDQFKRIYPYTRSSETTSKSDGFPYAGSYSGYMADVHPGIKLEFQSAAMRFGHTLVPPAVWRRSGCNFLRSTDPNSKRQYAALRLCNSYFDSRGPVEEDMDALFRGMASTIAEREDSILVPDLTESLFGPLEFSRRDLAALNIQRGRDHGLADYNTVRESYGLKKVETWDEINPMGFNKPEIRKLSELYNRTGSSLDELDLFTGGLLETTAEGPGELFHHVTLDLFLRIRHGDRFWFENTRYSGLTEQELYDVENTRLVDIINVVTQVSSQQVQTDVFRFRQEDGGNGCFDQPVQLAPNKTYDGVPLLAPCRGLETFDYFSGSEVSFAVSFFALAACCPLTLLIMLLLAKHRRSSIYRTRVLPQPLQRTTSSNVNEFRVLEWVDNENPERIVSVVLEPEESKISVYNTQKVLLRFADVGALPAGEARDGPVKSGDLELHLSSDHDENLIAVKLPEYDLVLNFHNREERDRFAHRLTLFIEARHLKVTRRHLQKSYILRSAVTRKFRQERLNKFFKKILGIFKDGDKGEENVYADTIGSEFTRIELTQAEFGEAFGMRPSSMFVKHMFMLVDKDKSGRVSFREFLDIFILLSSDDIESKIRLLFNMYDLESRGYLAGEDVEKMIRSLLDLSGDASEQRVQEFLTAVYREAGLRVGQEMTFDNFRRVFATGNYAQTIKNASLGLNDSDADNDQAASPTSPIAGARMSRRRSTLLKGYSSLVSQSTQVNQEPEKKSKFLLPPTRPPPRKVRTPSISGAAKQATLSHSPESEIAGQGLAEGREGVQAMWDKMVGYCETNRLQIFWVTLYCLLCAGIFLERAVYYSMEREERGLRRVAGHGVTMSRGSASVIMFTYSGLLLTMCKNMITALRETVLNRVIPFDSFHQMHKIIACISLAFTVLHIVFHGSNLYHICTQPSTDLNCYLREYFRASHELGSFSYWAYQTTTGLTGVVLTLLLIVLFIFAVPYARRYAFMAFWVTHKLYFLIYPLIFIHGSVRMVQEPHFFYYVVGPVVLYTVDRLISTSRCTINLTIVKAELLPSDVTALKVKKPLGFEFKSGQWAQIAIDKLGSSEYHPFTMTSSPHEKFVTFHIRAVGPWTMNVRRLFDPANRVGKEMPKVLLDGPFGEGHQNWYKFEVAVLIGGGIGVTPFAAILKDIVHKSEMAINMQCKKVYFLWVTRTQKQFEWLTDIIRAVETMDRKHMVTTHIFVTEFKSNFDLRTSMLYVCERHFQKICGRSLFTGLEATTHFGRPKFFTFLDGLRNTHRKVRRFGVFSCGPRPMTLGVEQACAALNKYDYATYYHHYENF